MKKNSFYLSVFLISAMLLQMVACKKVDQQICKDPCSDLKICNISSYYYPGDGHSGTANTASFTYDALGNPLTVTNSLVGTGIPNLIFKYDAAHRLTEFIRPYSNGLFEQWFKYVYDASGKIVSDTSYIFGELASGPVNYAEARVTTYTYDNTCRIVATKTVPIEGPNTGSMGYEEHYSYDANGNLVRPGITYDNKVNIHRTNKIFMFVDRDYSMNNPYTAASYNGYGLPAHVGAPTPGPSVYFLQRHIDNAVFDYQCD